VLGARAGTAQPPLARLFSRWVAQTLVSAASRLVSTPGLVRIPA